MILKSLENVTEADLQALITNSVSEGKTIEYKQALPGGADTDKKEFLADVSSFANTTGGDLIFGVTDNQGTPAGIAGVTTSDMDLERRRLDSIIASGLEPRIRYSTKVVDCQSGAKVLIIRSERSWSGPHRVIFKGHDKFYGRNSAGKYPLDVGELRTAFTLSATITERIANFRTDRIISLSNNDTPIPFVEDAKLILHCMPIESFAGRPHYDVLQYFDHPDRLRPMQPSGWDRSINLEGVISYSGNNPAFSYTQIYRNGVIEVVNGSLLAHEYRGRKVIPSIAYEQAVFDYLPFCFQKLQELGCAAPVVVALTLTGVKGLQMGVDSYGFDIGQPINSNVLILPEAVVEDLTVPPGKILKPMFDLVWNACGYPTSKNFDVDSNWVPRR